mmetsp:Transcript_38209/g.114319  ORF Transcript_38209/g.114319 Transcript_38209/m.114319 type:complete len:387 (-) Transcript_38209:1213-2373(-)
MLRPDQPQRLPVVSDELHFLLQPLQFLLRQEAPRPPVVHVPPVEGCAEQRFQRRVGGVVDDNDLPEDGRRSGKVYRPRRPREVLVLEATRQDNGQGEAGGVVLRPNGAPQGDVALVAPLATTLFTAPQLFVAAAVLPVLQGDRKHLLPLLLLLVLLHLLLAPAGAHLGVVAVHALSRLPQVGAPCALPIAPGLPVPLGTLLARARGVRPAQDRLGVRGVPRVVLPHEPFVHMFVKILKIMALIELLPLDLLLVGVIRREFVLELLPLGGQVQVAEDLLIVLLFRRMVSNPQRHNAHVVPCHHPRNVLRGVVVDHPFPRLVDPQPLEQFRIQRGGPLPLPLLNAFDAVHMPHAAAGDREDPPPAHPRFHGELRVLSPPNVQSPVVSA